ncbi:LexA family protein [Derxia gummosa]|uniref:LexA family protein n=1 Tax=Derxia gummosa DSM 723 TaxID=1121388 RepID=A0A8B6X9P2_9BURK|nr:S24 family peptidase [Derxia gummosa]
MLKDRIQTILDETGIKNVELANAAGCTRALVTQWLDGTAKSISYKHARGICRQHNYRLDWLIEGAGPKRPDDGMAIDDEPALKPVSTIRSVPLISWVAAGPLCEVSDPHPVGGADDWLPCPVPCSEGTYALEVVGDSMEPEYREGEIVFVDPQLAPRHGDDVIVRTPEGRATFKRYQDTPEGRFLLVLNESYPQRRIVVPEGTMFCGVVIFSGRRRRK